MKTKRETATETLAAAITALDELLDSQRDERGRPPSLVRSWRRRLHGPPRTRDETYAAHLFGRRHEVKTTLVRALNMLLDAEHHAAIKTDPDVAGEAAP